MMNLMIRLVKKVKKQKNNKIYREIGIGPQ